MWQKEEKPGERVGEDIGVQKCVVSVEHLLTESKLGTTL